jgi:hypothetical protein
VSVVVFGGGRQPRPDLLALAERAKLGMVAELASNGIVLDANMARLWRGRCFAGVIGIDRLRDFNDRYRGMVGAFERASAQASQRTRRWVGTALCMTLTRRNAGHLHALIDHPWARVDQFRCAIVLVAARA